MLYFPVAADVVGFGSIPAGPAFGTRHPQAATAEGPSTTTLGNEAESCTVNQLVVMSHPHYQADVVVEDKVRLLTELQKKVVSLERRLQGNLSQDEHLQEFLQEVNTASHSVFGVDSLLFFRVLLFHHLFKNGFCLIQYFI